MKFEEAKKRLCFGGVIVCEKLESHGWWGIVGTHSPTSFTMTILTEGSMRGDLYENWGGEFYESKIVDAEGDAYFTFKRGAVASLVWVPKNDIYCPDPDRKVILPIRDIISPEENRKRAEDYKKNRPRYLDQPRSGEAWSH